MEINFSSGSIEGFQKAKSNHIANFRDDLNNLVAQFVETVNGIYNKDDMPGEYLFGFDAILSRPTVGQNSLMEEEYGLW